MVSSKHGGRLPPFKVPAVCKKKTPPGGLPPGGVPYPAENGDFFYDIDVSWLWFRHQFTGTRTLTREPEMFGFCWRWMDDPNPPNTGERARFMHCPGTGAWTASLWHWHAGPLVLSGLATGNIEDEPDDLQTGIFELNFGAIWLGKKDASFTSV